MVILRSGNNTDLISSTPDIPQPIIMSDNDNLPPNNDEAIEEITNLQINNNLLAVLDKLKTNEDSMSTVVVDITGIKNDITNIKDVTNESDGLKEQLYATQGKVVSLEIKNQQLQDKLVDFENKLYAKNLMFYNIDEHRDESEQSLKTTIYSIIKDKMKVPEIQIFSRENPAGEIRIDTATRMGRFRDNSSRSVIVTFISKTGRDLVYSRTYTKNLTLPIRIRVAEQYASITRERRQCQIESLKELRTNYQDTGTKVTLDKDKILVNGKIHKTGNFERNTLGSLTPLSINFDNLRHSDEITEKGSHFQGHSLTVLSKTQAVAARNSIYQSPKLSKSSHIMYAYKIGGPGESIESGFADDNEINGGTLLMNLIEKEKLTNIFLCVTRIKNGPNIGQNRFDHIKNCAKNVIQVTNSDDENEEVKEAPVFNRIMFH